MAQHADLIGKAWLQGKLYKIDYYPGAVLSNNVEDKIFGEVYRLHHAESLFPLLDRYEEVGPDFEEPNEYIRLKQPVFLISGDPITAWVYLYNRSTLGLQRIGQEFK